MSEADMDKNRPLENPNQPTAQNPSSHKPEPGEKRENSALTGKQPSEFDEDEWETVNFPNALSIKELEAAASAPDTQAPLTPTQPPQPSPTSAPGNNAGISQIAELIALIQQVRQRNNELTHRVATLENALHECQIALDITQNRSQTQEELLAERTQELETVQTKNQRLTHELEATSQNAQRQQILIQTLSEELETSQHRLAQMERECTLTQQRYSEQTQQLLQVENTCRDLRSRLHRQQRHTLQFKAALEKCLEIPDTMRDKKLDVIENTLVATEVSESSGIGATNADTTSLTPKTEPIKPWGAPAQTSAETATTNALEIFAESNNEMTSADSSTVPSGDAVLWDNITHLIDATQTARTAEPAPSLNSENIESPTPKPNWPAPVVYPQQLAKKRSSLAAIDLPSFPRLSE
ncbi:hypothetical protein NG798_21970 [Ancylothrix sp. C2]|uniref:hypothetical protein n=1 Tax=Ancylothrix sp. D3o TaxID=2953691 RepID=UPI0021BADFAD|nr:hypothetical protein [Ancylothrix sp. D3o]MCT7952465.1 hypothetical protein [Ancylothrix sp. D3o]